MNNKKVLVITHGVDIDGFGNVVLAKLAFKNVDSLFTETFDIDKLTQQKIDDKSIFNYDKIYVTDNCFSKEFAAKIDENNELKNKILVFDHHDSRENEFDEFGWINIITKCEKGKSCGTGLFYNYLIEKGFINPKPCINDFVELTRQYDTWEWKNKYNNEMPNTLNTFWQAVGRDKYIEKIISKIKLHSKENFYFTKQEQQIISNYIKNFNLEVNNYVSNIKKINFCGYSAGTIEIIDKYKNAIAQQVRDNGNPNNYEFLLMPILDRNTVSLRSLTNVDVSKIATKFGGGGHTAAASFPLSNLPVLKK